MKKILSLGVVTLLFTLVYGVAIPAAQAATITVGNDSTSRTMVDTYSNFTIIDTNHPVSADGILNTFMYYAATQNPFSFVLVDSSNVVRWVSDLITPANVGVNTYTSSVPVQAGWNLGVYFSQTGTIPYEYTGSASLWVPNNSGAPYVGQTLNLESTNFGPNDTNRTYSFVATGETQASDPVTVTCPTGTTQSLAPLETVTVPANSDIATLSHTILANGTSYILKASGTADAGDGIQFDARYSYRTPTSILWTDAVNSYEGYGPTLLDLFVNGSTPWGDYNSSHVYESLIAGNNNPASFLIYDIYSSNNVGNLSVDIYSCNPIPPVCNANATQTIVSDATTNVNGNNSSVATWVHTAWATIPDATWIWDTAQVTDPTNEQTNVFTKTFNIVGTPTSANLEIAADNGYKIEVNGHLVADKLSIETNYSPTTSHDISSYLTTGLNTLTITVTNFALAFSTYDTNPAGLIYKLTINNNECVTPPLPPTTGSLTVIKKTIGGDGTFSFTGVPDGFSITTANGSGDKTVENLTPGSYTITETPVAGWNTDESNCVNVPVEVGQTAVCTITNTAQSSISGVKYNDINRNGRQDPGELGLKGWVIRLLLDGTTTDDDTLIATTTTNADGSYTFSNVAPGTYDVRETHQKNWKRTSKNPMDIVIVPGSNITGVDFGNATIKKGEKEDTDKDDNCNDNPGKFFGNRGWSNYFRDQNNKDHQQPINYGHTIIHPFSFGGHSFGKR